MPMAGTRVEAVKAIETAGAGKDGKKSKGESLENLAWVAYIWYPIIFWKKSFSMSTLFNSGNKVKAIHSTFAQELGLFIRPTDIGAQKIDNITLGTYGMIVAVFSVTDKANWVRFFEKIFLLANINPEVVLGMSFLTLSGADVNFLGRELR